MMRIKRRAYLSILALLAALGGIAYYANEQAKHYEVAIDESGRPYSLQKEGGSKAEAPVPPPSIVPDQNMPLPEPLPAPAPSDPTPTEKSKTFIIELDHYTTKTSSVTVPKGYKANLVMKVDRSHSGDDGLSFWMEDQYLLQVMPGETEAIGIRTSDDVTIYAYIGKTMNKAPYSIQVKVE